mmetsp:Transcript_58951/g.129416  ORF Transcript_58951/g.129416 Transcript_58951/m.129416 type:complete len:96 (+) Transcript_58951:241-528(+)
MNLCAHRGSNKSINPGSGCATGFLSQANWLSAEANKLQASKELPRAVVNLIVIIIKLRVEAAVPDNVCRTSQVHSRWGQEQPQPNKYQVKKIAEL